MNKVTIIGAGSMAEALISGIVEQKIMNPRHVWVTNRSNQERLRTLHKQYGVSTTYKMTELMEETELIILAMKPKDIQSAIDMIRPYLTEKTLLISLLAGISMTTIEKLCSISFPIVRAMPNTSAAIGQSATALACNTLVTERHRTIVQSLFETVGLTVFVDESQLDAVTGLSGSGPAYVYYLIEAMEKSAVEIGLAPQLAQKLILQTLIGAAGMVAHSNKSPAQLRKEVTSPGGTTEAGLSILQEHHVQESIIQCIKEATAQSKRMGDDLRNQIDSNVRS